MLRRRTILAAIVVLACAVSAMADQSGRWELLGSRTVTDRADRDSVKVGGDKGNFTAIKLEVQRRAVRFQRVVIRFRNGDDQKVELRDTIGANGESRVIDIDGRDRVIRSIDFWYEAQSLGRGGQATVRVLGRN
jgi:hypothetical protein